MKKSLTLLCLSMALGFTTQASDWHQQLVDLNPGVIDSVSMITDESNADLYSSYMIHYHQPLQHDTPELGNLPLRALLTVRNDEDFAQQMTQVYIGGYQLDSVWATHPNYYFERLTKESPGELADRYHGNLLVPEHRYFGKSCPENPWESLGYCEAREAAADFHALLQAMKRVFGGKWAISGVSKGGITTTMQHAFYPDDADCFVPYSGPFLSYSNDLRMQERYMAYGWNQELNQQMLHLQRLMTSSEELFDLFCLVSDIDPAEGINDPVTVCNFADGVCHVDFSHRAYDSREEVARIFASNEDVLRQLGLETYMPEMMLYMLFNGTILIDQNFFDWYEQYFTPEAAADGPRRTHARLKEGVELKYKRRVQLPVFGIDQASWDYGVLAYFYQAWHELGYYDMRFDYYYDDPDEAHRVNQMWQSLYHNALEPNYNTLFAPVEYNPELFAFVRLQTAQTQKPILFLYGGDDTWTGAHMEDEYINGDNVRLYILPEQNHMVSIGAVADSDLQRELWAFTDAIFDPTPVGISTLHDDASAPARYYDLYGRRLSEQSLRGRIVLKR